MIVVSNTTPLVGLAVIGRFDLLRQLFGHIQIPQAVYDEVIARSSEQGGARDEVITAEWVEVVRVINREAVDELSGELDLGEAEAIVLAREIGAEWVLMDEKIGQRKLDEFGLDKIGTAGILLKAKEVDVLSLIQPDLERLRRYGFRISLPVMNTILHQANEL